jgi:two-component system cell cycle response regulator
MALPTRLIVVQRPSEPLATVCIRLSEWNCELGCCSSRAGALKALTTEGADVLLIDAWVEEGMALLAQLKADPHMRHLPVVIATADEEAVVAAHALALGADDILILPIDDTELYARIRALARLATMEVERHRREVILAQFGVAPLAEMPGVPAIDRVGVLLIGPAGGDQVQAMTALGGVAVAAYAETAESALERLRRDNLEVALITASRDHDELQRLCAAIRADLELFDLPVLLIGRPDCFPDRSLPFYWGVSDVLFQPFQPEVLRLRVQGWVRQQRLRRRLRGSLDEANPPPTTDRLTRLFGHGFLHGYVERLIAENQRSGMPLALASFDVAGLSQINQTHGYAAGDQLLAQLGGIIVRTSRAEDLPARLGADRFCLVINGASAEDARALGERIATILSQMPLRVGNKQTIRVALTTGVAELEQSDDAASLIARAFERMQPLELRQAS